MAASESTGGYASLYAITPDWHPIVDEVPAGSGFYACSGFSGHGFKLGPAVGVMVADLLTGASAPDREPMELSSSPVHQRVVVPPLVAFCHCASVGRTRPS